MTATCLWILTADCPIWHCVYRRPVAKIVFTWVWRTGVRPFWRTIVLLFHLHLYNSLSTKASPFTCYSSFDAGFQKSFILGGLALIVRECSWEAFGTLIWDSFAQQISGTQKIVVHAPSPMLSTPHVSTYHPGCFKSSWSNFRGVVNCTSTNCNFMIVPKMSKM